MQQTPTNSSTQIRDQIRERCFGHL